MENPATWNEAEKIIDKAYQKWWWDREMGAVVGVSLAAQIAGELRKRGLLIEENDAPN